MAQYNLKNRAVKRLMKEAEELREPTKEYSAYPLEDNLFEWHFTLRGPEGTDFDGGIYHGRITLPPEYPMKPPSIILLTPNGRFEVNKKICLSISGHHPETWQPSWSIRTAILAIIGFLPTHGNGAIGSLDYTPEERKSLAIKSQNWKCMECGYIRNFLKEDVKVAEENTELLNINSQQKSEVSQPTSSDTVDLLIEKDLKQESKSFSKVEHVQSNGFENHNTIPQSAQLPNFSVQETAFIPRNRHLTSDQATANSTMVETNTVKSDKIKNIKTKETNSIINYCSLLVIWIIVIVLTVLIARRVLYQ